tara:strand:- start:336 stop:2030 length:1695 start_codon:yes stop_codon:yes gene_type:complete
MKKKLLLIALNSLLILISQAQTVNFEWAKSMGGSTSDMGISITTDNFGNVYTAGLYEGVVDFDPSASTFNLTPFGSSDIFIQKLDINGNFIWAKSIGGSGSEYNPSISVDLSGNVYTIGLFEGTIDLDPSLSSFYLTSNGLLDAFIQKLDANGNFIWAKSIGGVNNDDPSSIIIDTSGIYITGYFDGTVDFDPNSAIYNLTSNGQINFYILKLDTNGNFIWAKSAGGSSSDFSTTITLDIFGNVYITGGFGSTVDFDPGINTFNLTSNGNWDVFIQKLDANGNFIWAKSMGGPTNDYSFSITTDNLGNVYVTGPFEGVADFDPSLSTFNLTSQGSSDIFVQKLDLNGNFIWAKSMGGNLTDIGWDLIVDDFGNTYVTGSYMSTVDFDPSASTFNLTSNGNLDFFIQKLDANGNFIWVESFGGGLNEEGLDLLSDGLGNLYLTGRFQAAVDFDPSPSTFILTSNGNWDTFILKLSLPIGVGTLDLKNNLELNIFPNPTSGKVSINLSEVKTNLKVTLTNNLGQVIFTQQFESTDFSHFNIDSPKGMYFLQLEVDGEVITKKIIKK